MASRGDADCGADRAKGRKRPYSQPASPSRTNKKTILCGELELCWVCWACGLRASLLLCRRPGTFDKACHTTDGPALLSD